MSKKTSSIFIMLGLILSLIALWITFANLHAAPVMLKTPEGATQQVKNLMDNLCSGNDSAAEAILYGNPDLGLDRQPESLSGKLLYPLYRKSLTYEICHAPSVTDTGLALCVAVTALDMGELTEMLAAKIIELPEEEAALPESWAAALAEIPAESYPKTQRTVTLNLVHEQDRWWILPEEPLLNVVSGIVE